MTLNLYNTLTNQKEVFHTLEAGKVKIYCCGITAYDYCHLGHGRTCLVWDVVRRYLQWRGYDVRYIQNFTDIDDKILNRAKKEKTTMDAIAQKYIDAYFEDMEKLNIQKADFYPRATHTLNGIQKLIAELEAKGFAYASQGDVYYSVNKFKTYGKLSGRKLEDLKAGASGRVEVNQIEDNKKEDSFDFALWKSSKEGEPFWESPWGNGRPGWHIECSAMVREHLGESIDIHVGGSDLIFPHHENEIAQSEAVTNHPLATYWLHNGMVKIEGEKMSKSLNNFITIRELLNKYEPMAVRLFVLQAHYRKPLDFTDDALEAATNGWQTLKDGLLFGEQYGEQLGFNTIETESINSDNIKETESKAIQLQISESNEFTNNNQDKSNKYKKSLIVVGSVILTITIINFLHSILTIVNHIPLASTFFIFVGLVYTIWFALQYLLKAEDREDLEGKIDDISIEFIGKNFIKKNNTKTTKNKVNPIAKIRDRFQKVVDDDFNFSGGLAVIFELEKELRKEGNLLKHQGEIQNSPQSLYQQWITLKELAQVFGLEASLDGEETSQGLSDEDIETLITQRTEARNNKNYAEGDRIRDELKEKGIVLVDQKGGITTWYRE